MKLLHVGYVNVVNFPSACEEIMRFPPLVLSFISFHFHLLKLHCYIDITSISFTESFKYERQKRCLVNEK